MEGFAIAERMEIEEGAGVWIFDDCVVREAACDHDLHCFAVYMATANGSIVRQDVVPGDIAQMEEDRQALDNGEAPTDGWEDGIGNSVCPENGEIVDGGFSVEQYNGTDGTTDYYATAEEAVAEAEHDWNHMSDGDRRRYSDRSAGAYFEVLDRDGYVVRDFVEESRRAQERSRFEAEDADYLGRSVIEALVNRRGHEWMDSAYALADAWDGTEDVSEIAPQYDMDADEAMDMLDAIMAIHVIAQREAEE